MSDSTCIDDRRSVTMSEIMTPNMVNFQGNIHGGFILQMLDRVAYVCASRYSEKNIVTLSADEVVFKEPIYVGELVIFYSTVNFVGSTSMEVGIRVVAENLRTAVQRQTNSCYFTMVAVDESGKPTKVKPLTLNTELQRKRFNDGLARRDARLKMKAK